MDFYQNISNCSVCGDENACVCEILDVCVQESIIFSDNQGIAHTFYNKKHAKHQNYQLTKKHLLTRLKEKFPKTKKFVFYPVVTEIGS